MVVGQMRQRLAFAHQGAFAEQGLDQIHRHHGGAVVHVKGGVECWRRLNFDHLGMRLKTWTTWR